jgi:hypothetical protein
MVSAFNAVLLTLYATAAVGGNFPVVERAKLPRAEEILITFGAGETCRRARKAVVRRATEVMFVENVVSYAERKSVSEEGVRAMPALLMST